MDWKERAMAMAEARSSVHDTYKIPALYSPDNGVSWRVVFCRLHEAANADGQAVGPRDARITVDTDQPEAIFRHADAPDLKMGQILSFATNAAYTVASSAPPDRYGYRKVKLKRDIRHVAYPVPDWETL